VLRADRAVRGGAGRGIARCAHRRIGLRPWRSRARALTAVASWTAPASRGDVGPGDVDLDGDAVARGGGAGSYGGYGASRDGSAQRDEAGSGAGCDRGGDDEAGGRGARGSAAVTARGGWEGAGWLAPVRCGSTTKLRLRSAAVFSTGGAWLVLPVRSRSLRAQCSCTRACGSRSNSLVAGALACEVGCRRQSHAPRGKVRRCFRVIGRRTLTGSGQPWWCELGGLCGWWSGGGFGRRTGALLANASSGPWQVRAQRPRGPGRQSVVERARRVNHVNDVDAGGAVRRRGGAAA
jgi:hypothetical protein